MVIVRSECIDRWIGGKLLKECQACKKEYSCKIQVCRTCQPFVRCRIRVVLAVVAETGASKISFGQCHRGTFFADVYDMDKSYMEWMLRQNGVGLAAPFAGYCRDRRDAEVISTNYGGGVVRS